MAGSLNRAMLIGHLGKDPEVRHTNDGRPVVTLSLATSESWKDKNTGERKEVTEWHRITIFNEGLCKVAENYLKKGSKVFIEGAIKTRKWTDKDGVEKYTTEIVLQAFNGSLTLLDRNENGGGTRNESDYGTESRRDAGEAKAPPPRDLDDEVPF